jgi:predicted metal-dependent HD superfamily phosphohydrolase
MLGVLSDPPESGMLGYVEPPGAELGSRWDQLIHELGWPTDRASEVGRDLIDRYGEAHRHYHDERHLLAVLRTLDELAAPHPPAVAARLAAWFHDAIYTGTTGDDEEASARLAESVLATLGTPPVVVAGAATMVRATARHFDPEADHDTETALLLDADLSILGADPTTYDEYCRGVRAEHADVGDDRFRAGRAAVLDALLARPRLFLTSPGFERFELRARQNLRREKTSIDRPGLA